MINSVEKNDLEISSFCDRDVFGTRIKSYYLCYSTDFDFVKFWVQKDASGAVTAAVSRVDGNITLCCDNPDFSELREFLSFVGFTTVQCEKSAAEQLFPEQKTKMLNGYVVEYVSDEPIEQPIVKKSFELREIYDIIKSQQLPGVGDYLPWVSDVTHRMNKGGAQAVLAECDGQNAGCAMVLFRTDKASLLGGVATLPQFRGRGIARGIVTFLADNERRSGRRTELLCKADSIVDFYKSIGFKVTMEWSLTENE